MSSSYRIGITGDMYDKIMAVATAQEALIPGPLRAGGGCD